jgi:ribonucleoside-diphosphate reductase alpha chain
MGSGRLPAALPQFSFLPGNPNSEVIPVPATISIEVQQPPLDESWPKNTSVGGMQVRKRNGSLESVDVNKIVRAVGRCAAGLPNVDVMRVAVKTIGGLYDGATTCELDQLSIRTAAALVVEEPEYSRLAARLLETYIAKEVTTQDIHSFSQSVAMGRRVGLIADETAEFVTAHARKLNLAVLSPSNDRF